jgi:REP element-mobilizing transposase RayT
MARRNRVSVPDAVYHITTRVAHRAMLLVDDGVKDAVFRMIYDVALFSGVEVFSCCVMDNHLHLLVHVPRVPAEYWSDGTAEPDAYAYGMRPPERRRSIWPDSGEGAAPPPRPAVGFMLNDDEFLRRLTGICGRERAQRRVEGWRALDMAGGSARAQADRERLCRRMYNVSQFMKTLKERITGLFNSPRGRIGHSGALWEGRFHSGIVERSARVMAVVAGYVEYNPVKAGIAESPDAWRWSSYSCALGDGPLAETCRRMYERMLGCPWDEARARMEAIFADRLPEDLAPDGLQEVCECYARRRASAVESPDGTNADGETAEEALPRVRASQAIHVTLRVFGGAFIGSTEFARRTLALLPRGFPAPGTRSARMCAALLWNLPPPRAA